MKTQSITLDRVDELLRFLPLLGERDMELDPQWHGLDSDAAKDGVFTMPHPIYPPVVAEFCRLASQPWWCDHDYTSKAADKMLQNDDMIASATLLQIKTMLTYCVRGERFCDGHWSTMIREGRIIAILRRLAQLRARVTDIDELLQLFARSIFSKADALTGLERTKNQRKRIRASITADIRTCGLLIYPDVRSPEVSEAAQLEADQIGKQIRTRTWYNQNGIDPGRKTFHWEHVDPISCIQKACEEATSEEAILNILKTRLRIAWILKREDAELTRLGYKSKRPDPDKAYCEAKIVLLKIEA